MGGHAWVSAIFRHGCIGVDVFFVLSGFVIASTTAKGAYSHEYVLKFIMARMSRIYVPYWIALPIALVVTAVGGGLQNISVIESVFLTTTDQRLLANPPTWFLVHLIFYYLIYAFSLLFSESTRERMYIVLVVSGALSAFFNPVGVFIAQPQILEFFAGVLVYRRLDRLSVHPFGLTVMIIATIGLFYAGVSTNAEVKPTRVLLYGGASLFLVASFWLFESRGRLKFPRWIATVSESAYMLFLIHVPMISVFYISGFRDYLSGLPAINRDAGFLAWLLLIVIMSIYIHRMAEVPFGKFVSRRLSVLGVQKVGPSAQ